MSAISDFAAFKREVVNPAPAPELSWCPFGFRLSPRELEEFRALCHSRHITVIDNIDRQLLDLAGIRLPLTATTAARDRFVHDTLAANKRGTAYGTWMFLPWEDKVVHLLDRDDYFEVITNRNRNKITIDEQRLLRAKRIGVIGLSVGAEAAATVVQEHLCGQIVLADFDRLDLSNLNRLNAAFDELGLPKTVIAARRIAKMDPYVHITLYERITEANVQTFLTGLDLLIEECDGLRVKYDVRQVAKERRLNVIFGADERGFLSIEPYAYTPDLPLFHGQIHDAPPEHFPTALDRMKALAAWLGGWDNISRRSQDSLMCLGDTTRGYPQLASEARYLAGQLGYVARRLLLGERLSPFVGNLDLTDLLAGRPTSTI